MPTALWLLETDLVTSSAQVDVAAVAAVIGEPARYAMLSALLDGCERPAGELARAAGVSAATASGHLGRLVAMGLLAVRACGRHRYFSLAGPLVARALEASPSSLRRSRYVRCASRAQRPH